MSYYSLAHSNFNLFNSGSSIIDFQKNIQLPHLFLIKTKDILVIIPETSQNKFHQIRIIKSKVIHVQIPLPKWEKTKKRKKKIGLQNGVIRRLQIGGGFRDYKSGQKGLQIGIALSGRKDYKSWQGFQIMAKRFQIRTGITNCCKTQVRLSRCLL